MIKRSSTDLAQVPARTACPFCEEPQTLPNRVLLTKTERSLRRRGMKLAAAVGMAVVVLAGAGAATGLLYVARVLAWIVALSALPGGLYMRATADQDLARLDAATTRSSGLGERMRRGLADLLTWGEVSRQERGHEQKTRARLERAKATGTGLAAMGVAAMLAQPVLGAILAGGTPLLVSAGLVVTAVGASGVLSLRDRPHACPKCGIAWNDREIELRRLLEGRLHQVVHLLEAQEPTQAAQLVAGTLAFVRQKDAGLTQDLHARFLALEACLRMVNTDRTSARTSLKEACSLAREPQLAARLGELQQAVETESPAIGSDVEREATWMAEALDLADQLEKHVTDLRVTSLDRIVDPARMLEDAAAPVADSAKTIP